MVISLKFLYWDSKMRHAQRKMIIQILKLTTYKNILDWPSESFQWSQKLSMVLETMSKLMILNCKSFTANHFFTLSFYSSVGKKWTVQWRKRKLAFLASLEIYWKEGVSFEDCCWGTKFASTLIQNYYTKTLGNLTIFTCVFFHLSWHTGI